MKTTVLFLTALFLIEVINFSFNLQPEAELALMVLGKIFDSCLNANPLNNKSMPWSKFKF
jgi:hypothetical protein